jgi:hypothetical protein
MLRAEEVGAGAEEMGAGGRRGGCWRPKRWLEAEDLAKRWVLGAEDEGRWAET